MDGQRARLVTRRLDRVPAVPPAPGPRSRATGPVRQTAAGVPATQLLKVAWAAALGLGWPLVTVASMAIEPAPADPGAPVPAVIELAALAWFTALLTTAVAAGMRHRAAAVAGVTTGVISLAFTVSCPVSGHHQFGLWWYGQLVLGAVMLGVSLAALGDRARAAG